MNRPEIIAAFAALAEPTRLDMVRAMVRAGPDGIAAGVLAEAVGATPSRASFHLSVLTDAGLVHVRPDAKKRMYSVDFTAMGQIAAYVLEDCCAGHETARACCQSLGSDCC